MTDSQAQRVLAKLDELERNKAWLARKLRVDLSLVYRWLSGERPIPEPRRAQIALALGQSADWLEPDEQMLRPEPEQAAA